MRLWAADMSMITRHILFEFLKVFLTTLAVVMIALVLSDVIKELQNRGFRLPQIVLILPFLIPYAVKSAMHGALLFAACSVFGRMAASNELVALKSLGIPPLKAIWPAIALAAPLGLAAVYLDEIDATWGGSGIQQVLIRHIDEIAYGVLQRTHVYRGPNFELVVQHVEGRKLIHPTLKIRRDGEPLTIIALEGELRARPVSDQLRVILNRGTIVGDNYEGSFPDSIEHDITVERPNREAYTWDRCQRQRQVVERFEGQLASVRPGTQQQALAEQLADAQRSLRQCEAQWQHKWANGFCCFFFVLIGAPAAIVLRFDSWLANFFACFLPIIVVYQPLHKLPIYLAESGTLPCYCVWGAQRPAGRRGPGAAAADRAALIGPPAPASAAARGGPIQPACRRASSA